jgi:ABC-2 type transport system permease protein
MTRGGSWRAFRAQARIELVLTARRAENLLVTLGVPLVLLVFLATVPLLPGGAGETTLGSLVPAILTVAVISTGLVSLGIATAFERGYGVLKRLAGSPLPAWALLAAKSLAVAVTVACQVVLIAAAALLLGWSPPTGPFPTLLAALPWLALGTLAFCAMGLLLAGTLRPEAVLAAANGLYLVFILLGGVVVPLDRLPPPVAVPASVLPPALLADLLRGALAPAGPVDLLPAAGALTAWTVVLAAAAVATFRAD